MRIVYTPHPVTDRSSALSRKYLEGLNPISGKPILEDIVAALTEPVSDEDKGTGFLPREPRTRFLEPETVENLEKYFYENNFTDELPIVLPTESVPAPGVTSSFSWAVSMRARRCDRGSK